jgi:glyoxylase-like metal-dependent hydrolase (beta-lactamase superfamily II)
MADPNETSAEPLAFNRDMAFAYDQPKEIAPGVARLVAPNPGPFTFKGTNTYLLGTERLAVVDPGPDDARHVAAILAAAAGRPITHILATHAHRDHVDAIPRLRAATGAIVRAMPRTGPPHAEPASGPSGRDFIDYAVPIDEPLGDGEIFEAGDLRLTAIHTPGHAPDHLCFALGDSGMLLSGDHVMGWNTSVIAPPEGDMADYLASLEKLTSRTDTVFLPGHGGRIREPARTLRAYLLHRRWREQAILEAIRAGTRTIRTIVPIVYPDLAAPLLRAAALSVEAHVEHLLARGLLQATRPLSLDGDLSAT